MLTLGPNNRVDTPTHFLNASLLSRQAWLMILTQRCNLETSVASLGIQHGPRVTCISTVDPQAVKEDATHGRSTTKNSQKTRKCSVHEFKSVLLT